MLLSNTHKPIVNKHSLSMLNEIIIQNKETEFCYNSNLSISSYEYRIDNSAIELPMNIVYKYDMLDDNRRPDRKTYYDESQNFYIELGLKKYKYVPKAGVIIFNKTFTKVLMTINKAHNRNIVCDEKLGFYKILKWKDEMWHQTATRQFNKMFNNNIIINEYDPVIFINNSAYYIYYIDEDYKLLPKDNNDSTFVNLDCIDNVIINHESKQILKETSLLCKKVAVKLSQN
jgi:hypothetical protein